MKRSSYHELRLNGWRLFTIVLLLLAVLLWFGVGRISNLPDWVRQVGYVLGMFTCVVAIRCAKRVKQYNAFSAEELLTKDKRKPVLYLRSFSADKHGASYSGRSPLVRSTNEEQLAEMLSEIGPVIAIGRPDDKLPQLGAARQYVDDDKWQSYVEKCMRRAQLVVVRIGQTEGLWWEISTAVKLAKSKRLVLLVPPDLDLYQSFLESSEGLFPHPLPDVKSPACGTPNARHYRYGLWAVIAFASKWKPTFHKLHSPFWRQGIEKPVIPSLKFSFRSVFQNLRIRWAPPPVNLGAVFVTILALVFIAFTLPAAVVDFIRWISR